MYLRITETFVKVFVFCLHLKWPIRVRGTQTSHRGSTVLPILRNVQIVLGVWTICDLSTIEEITFFTGTPLPWYWWVKCLLLQLEVNSENGPQWGGHSDFDAQTLYLLVTCTNPLPFSSCRTQNCGPGPTENHGGVKLRQIGTCSVHWRTGDKQGDILSPTVSETTRPLIIYSVYFQKYPSRVTIVPCEGVFCHTIIYVKMCIKGRESLLIPNIISVKFSDKMT